MILDIGCKQVIKSSECQVKVSGFYPAYHGGSTEGFSAGGWYNSGSIFGRLIS